MKRDILILCATAILFNHSIAVAELSDASQKVKSAYVALRQFPSDKNLQLAYLAAFPADFDQFLAVFMPEDFTQLYDGHDYISAMKEIGQDLPKQTITKILMIESTARWDADAPNYLQQVSIELALLHLKEFAESFSELKPAEQKGIIAFLVDGPHRPTEDFLKLTKKLKRLGYIPLSNRLLQAGTSAQRKGGH